MTRFARFLLVVTSVATLAVLLPLAFGVWLPDTWASRPSVIATAQTADGQRFQIVQQWGSDFYTTTLVQTWPDGARSTYLIDGDDTKHWDAHLCVAARGHRSVVALPDRACLVVPWQRDGQDGRFLLASSFARDPIR